MKTEDLFYEPEGNSLDFKQKQYPFDKAPDNEKAELLKDIIAFANAWRRETAYILVGLKERKGKPAEIVGIDESIDDAKIQQFVNTKVNSPIEFLYYEKELDNKKVGIFEIPIQKKRPYYLKKNYTKLMAETVYIRRGSSTVIANPSEIADMGKNQKDNSEINFDFGFYSKENNDIIGEEINLEVNRINLPEEDDIPDYGQENTVFDLVQRDNRDYYRELANWIKVREEFKKVNCYIKNNSPETIYNIYSENNISIESLSMTKVKLGFPHKKEGSFDDLIIGSSVIDRVQPRYYFWINEDYEKNTYNIGFRSNDIFPGEMIIFDDFFICPNITTIFKFNFIFYGENIIKPIKKELIINFSINKKTLSVDDLIEYDGKFAT